MAIQGLKNWVLDESGRATATEWDNATTSRIPFYVEYRRGDFSSDEEYVQYLTALGENYLQERDSSPPGKPLKSMFASYDDYESSLRMWELKTVQREIQEENQPPPPPPDPELFDHVAAAGAPDPEERRYGEENKQLKAEGNRLVSKGQELGDENLIGMGKNLLREYKHRREEKPYGFEVKRDETNYLKLRGELDSVLDKKNLAEIKDNSLWYKATVAAVNQNEQNKDDLVYVFAEDAQGNPFVTKAPTGTSEEAWKFSQRLNAEEHAFRNISDPTIKPFGSREKENPEDSLTQRQFEFKRTSGRTVPDHVFDRLKSGELRVALATGKFPDHFKEETEDTAAAQEHEEQPQAEVG